MKAYQSAVLSIAAVFLFTTCGGSEPTPAPTFAPTQAPAAGLGTLEVRVTSRPPAERVTSALVTVQHIEVNRSKDSGETGWHTIETGPTQFDLAKMVAIEELLGSSRLEAGRYEQVRLQITETILTILGNVRRAEVLADTLVFSGAFEVEAGATTILTLDFDAEGSLKFRPGIGPGLDPVVRLLARNDDQALAAASIVAAIGEETVSAPPEPGVPSGTIRVAFPVADNLQWMNFYVAQGAGFFEDEGLDIRVVVPPDPFVTTRLMVMGQAEVAVLPRPLYLEAIGRGEPVVAFANLLASDPINLVVQKELAEEHGLSMDMPLAERLNALKGLKVGVAPGPPVRLRTLFESVGLDADRDIEIVILDGNEQNPAFGEGRIDALFAHTPYLETALVDQGAVMLVNQSAGEVLELTNRQIHILATSRDFANAHPETLMAMTRAIYRAQQLIHTDLRTTAQAIRASDVKLQAPKGLETIIAIYEPAIPQTPEVSVESAVRELGFFPAHRTPPDLSGVDMTQHIDNRFAQQAVASNQ